MVVPPLHEPAQVQRKKYEPKRDCEVCARPFLTKPGQTRCAACLKLAETEEDTAYDEFRSGGPLPQVKTHHLAPPLKQAIFDLETFSLDRGWGVLMVGSILVHGDGPEPKNYTFDLTESPKWPDVRSDDSDLAARIIQVLSKCHILYAHNGCVSPDHLILTADLRWVPASDVKVGDALFSCEDEAQTGTRRRWRTGIVEHNEPFKDQIYRVILEDGTVLRCNGRHPWLSGGGVYRPYYWRQTANLLDGRADRKSPFTMPRFMYPWSSGQSYSEGWLAGFFDGEGSLTAADREKRLKFNVVASQKLGPTMSRAEAMCATHGFDVGISQYDAAQRHIASLRIRGGLAETLRFLGQVRPGRLLGKFVPESAGAMKNCDPVKVVAVEPAGEDWVSGLQVSTGTYVVEGFVAHNSRYDIPWLNSLALKYGMPRLNAKLIDPVQVARQKYRIGSNSLGSLANFLGMSENKMPVPPEVWRTALFDNCKESWQILRARCESDVRLLNEVASQVTLDVGMIDRFGSSRG